MSSFDLAIPVILRHEGGYANNPNDPGGATKYGISLYWLKSLKAHDTDGTLFADVNHDGRVDIADIKALTLETAPLFYRKFWWDEYHFEKLIVQPLATKVFDTAVNMGGIPAIRILQRAVNTLGGQLVLDGVLGPNTLLGANAADPAGLLTYYRVYQAERYRWLVSRNDKLAEFLKGWLKRASE